MIFCHILTTLKTSTIGNSQCNLTKIQFKWCILPATYNSWCNVPITQNINYRTYVKNTGFTRKKLIITLIGYIYVSCTYHTLHNPQLIIMNPRPKEYTLLASLYVLYGLPNIVYSVSAAKYILMSCCVANM